MSSDEHKNKADAYVTCRDGKIRYFTADDSEVFYYKGRKYTYLLWGEIEGRGFITMFVCGDKYLLAPNHMQPVLVEAKTWAGRWNWKSVDKNDKIIAQKTVQNTFKVIGHIFEDDGPEFCDGEWAEGWDKRCGK